MHRKRKKDMQGKFNMIVIFRDGRIVVVEYSEIFNNICNVLFLLNKF